VVFNQPVSAVTANNLANYLLKTNGGASISLQSAQLASDLRTVSLQLGSGSSFAAGGGYNLTVGGVADILSATNVVVSTNVTFSFSTTGPIGIAGASSLTNQTVTENQTVTFSVAATGQTPYYYQWLYNSLPLPGQTNATLSFAAPWNVGGNYSVVVSNQFSALTSAPPAVLTVLPDTTPPVLTSLRGLAGTLNEIVLNFDAPVDPVTATSLATYSIPTSSSTGLAILGATLSANGLQVVLSTTAQVHGQTNQITITNLKDRSHVPNSLTVTAQFVSTISYRDEVLATPGVVRYFTFDETNGSSSVNSLVSKFDTSPLNIVGTVRGTPALPSLGVPGLVPNVPNNTALSFNGAPGTNRVELPNGADINSTLGPWYQITTLFYFKANALPIIQTNSAGTATNYQVPVLFSDLQYAVYLFPTQTSNNPSQAQLVFEGQNTSSQGAGSPWGGNSTSTAKYVAYTITTNQVYQVATVMDGTAGFSTGELRLYVNGVRVGTVTGIGAIYQQPNNPPGFGQGYVESYNGFTKTINPELVTTSVLNDEPFNGVIDEFAYINQGALSDARIAQLYSFGQTNALGTNFTLVQATQPAPTLSFGFTSGAGSLNPGNLNFSWATNAAGYYLESTTNLASGAWVSNSLPATVIGGSNILNIPVGTNDQFFRLIHP
jgi:hypothetical protein